MYVNVWQYHTTLWISFLRYQLLVYFKYLLRKTVESLNVSLPVYGWGSVSCPGVSVLAPKPTEWVQPKQDWRARHSFVWATGRSITEPRAETPGTIFYHDYRPINLSGLRRSQEGRSNFIHFISFIVHNVEIPVHLVQHRGNLSISVQKMIDPTSRYWRDICKGVMLIFFFSQ